MNPKTVLMKSVWATGRPGSIMEMRLPVKQRLQEQWAPLSQSCLGGKNQVQGLGASVPVAAASPLCWRSSWPCTTGDVSFQQLTQRGNFCVTEHVHCWGSGSLFWLFVCLLVCGGVLEVLWGFGFCGATTPNGF